MSIIGLFIVIILIRHVVVIFLLFILVGTQAWVSFDIHLAGLVTFGCKLKIDSSAGNLQVIEVNRRNVTDALPVLPKQDIHLVILAVVLDLHSIQVLSKVTYMI